MFANINDAWGSLIVEECIRLDANYFCIAPGSRSAPLTVAAARHPQARTFVHFDERGLAFHALGYVTATRKPAVLICTSGTAVANFFPAIIEASKKKLPLIVITADRPFELRQTGSVQTIDQVGMFGKYVVWQADIPSPDLSIKPEVVLTTVDQAIYQALRRKGVVHLNCMFREPLAPQVVSTPWESYCQGIKEWRKSTKPYTVYTHGVEALSSVDLKNIAKRVTNIKSGIIVVGKLSGDAERHAVIHFARRLGWPIVADIASGLRLGEKNDEVIAYFDQALLSKSFPQIPVDGIIHLGGRMTSKRCGEFIDKQPLREYIMVLNHSLRNDPSHRVSLRIEASVAQFCEAISPLVKPRPKSKLFKELFKVNQRVDREIEHFIKQDQRLSEIHIARLVSQQIPHGSGLFLANSMPIRDMDMFADHKGHTVHVAGNRGASGIDGLIASASGFAQGLKKPVTLIIGDLASLHDLNSLALLRDIPFPFVIIILNNGGGGIFSFLPIAEHKDVFEKYFATVHGVTFANAAAMFELNYANPYDTAHFSKVYKQAINSNTATIIEVMTDRRENLNTHRALQKLL